jgi:hypothetical protein
MLLDRSDVARLVLDDRAAPAGETSVYEHMANVTFGPADDEVVVAEDESGCVEMSPFAASRSTGSCVARTRNTPFIGRAAPRAGL